MNLKRYILIPVCSLFLAQLPAMVLAEVFSIEGSVRMKMEGPDNPPPAIVEYAGPCGIKKPANVVHLWKSRVMDTTLWLTPVENFDILAQISPPPTLDLIGFKCEFWPKLAVARPDTLISIKNNDLKTQWIVIENGTRKEQIFLEPESKPSEVILKENHPLHIYSAFYPWMEASIKPVKDVIAATETTWDGRFYFNDIPAGRYILHAWNTALGETEEEIEVLKNTALEIIYEKVEKDIPKVEPTMLEELLSSDPHDNPFLKKKP